MLAVWLGLIGTLVSAFTADTGLVVKTVRFYRADPTRSPGQTQVTAFIQVPADLPTAGPTGEVSLTLSVQVLDSLGGILYQQGWQRRIALPYPRGEADRLDLFRFTLGPGAHQLVASVMDSVSGRRAEAVVPIEGYRAPPTISDLLVSPWLRAVASIDTIPQPGEFRRGGLIVAIAPEVVVGGPTASVAYLLETYAGTATEGHLTLTVVDENEVVRQTLGPTPVRLVAGIGLLTGQLELGDLPPARYQLRAAIDLGGNVVSRMAAFLADPTAANTPSALADVDYFARLSGPRLDEAYAPLAVIARPLELSGWLATGSDDDKRTFLARFWQPRDPTPATRGNERRARFYDGVTYTNAFYDDSLRRLAGWQTDRGRIFLREGLPTQVLRRPERGPVPAYEVWRYYEPVERYYVFADRGALGGFTLVRSSEERGEDRWQQILTPGGVREVVNFLGREVLTPRAGRDQ